MSDLNQEAGLKCKDRARGGDGIESSCGEEMEADAGEQCDNLHGRDSRYTHNNIARMHQRQRRMRMSLGPIPRRLEGYI